MAQIDAGNGKLGGWHLLDDDRLSPLPTTTSDPLEDLLGMLSSDDEDS
eukprot:COSAG01_NODE_13711_length_1545_cov_1.656985_1_plen_48_part_00